MLTVLEKQGGAFGAEGIMIIQKFGGTSLQNAPRIRQVARIIEEAQKHSPVVVVSAFAGVTDQLIHLGQSAFQHRSYSLTPLQNLHQNILVELGLSPQFLHTLFHKLQQCLEEICKSTTYSLKAQDRLLAFGELFASEVLAQYLTLNGLKAQAHYAPDLGLWTDEQFGNARPLPESYRCLKEALRFRNHLPIITGFIGKTRQGDWTTLGRSGSDLTASILAKALEAKEIQLWKEVPGVLTADPLWVPHAQTIPQLSYEEASELAYCGAKIFHPTSILPAIQDKIPLKVYGTLTPDLPGTQVSESSGEMPIKSIVYKKEIAVLHLNIPLEANPSYFLHELFGLFARYHCLVRFVDVLQQRLTLSLDPPQNPEFWEHLNEKTSYTLEKEKAFVCVVGQSLSASQRLRVTTAFSNEKNSFIFSQKSKHFTLGFLLPQDEGPPLIRKLHHEFFESSP